MSRKFAEALAYNQGLRESQHQIDVLTKERDDLREALRYARRFLNSEDHDTAYVDAALANSAEETGT